MSNNKLSVEDSYGLLTAQIHSPVFFEKLARDWNIRPNNEEDAKEMLMTAGYLRNYHDQQKVKQASANTNMYSQARQDLQSALGQTPTRPAYNATQIKEAAQRAAQNPLLKEAALTYYEYLTKTLNGNS